MKNSPFCRLVIWLLRSGCIKSFSVHLSSTIHFTVGCLLKCVSSASVLCVWQYLGGKSGFLKLPSETDGRWKICYVADVIWGVSFGCVGIFSSSVKTRDSLMLHEFTLITHTVLWRTKLPSLTAAFQAYRGWLFDTIELSFPPATTSVQ